MIEAGTWNDEDAVMLTGYTHVANDTFVTNTVNSSLYPANQDPKFTGQGYDDGYLTTRPGTRSQIFYAPATTAPPVVLTDEITKDVFGATELSEGITLGGNTQGITHPVMVAVGSDDQLFCIPGAAGCTNSVALHDQEQPFFGPQAPLSTVVIQNAGHDLNLATNTRLFQDAMLSWVTAVSP